MDAINYFTFIWIEQRLMINFKSNMNNCEWESDAKNCHVI